MEKNNHLEVPNLSSDLMKDLRQIIDSARQRVAVTANAELTMMYWHIGERINREVLGNQRAEYGKRIVSMVATQLQNQYGTKGFEIRNIRRMMQFAQKIPKEQIVSQLATQLTWSHIIEVLPVKDPLAVEFYLTMSSSGRWGRNRLRRKLTACSSSVLPLQPGLMNSSRKNLQICEMTAICLLTLYLRVLIFSISQD